MDADRIRDADDPGLGGDRGAHPARLLDNGGGGRLGRTTAYRGQPDALAGLERAVERALVGRSQRSDPCSRRDSGERKSDFGEDPFHALP
jgi:hypothetical protein